MRILLLGANGQVGSALYRALAAHGQMIPATRTGKIPGLDQSCEVANFEQPETLAAVVHRVAPNVVINAAAYTAVDEAESDPTTAYQVNSAAVAALACACKQRRVPLIHYSTDYVFDGASNRPWREDDATNPLNIYGSSKLAGEEAIRASGCQHLVLRTGWVYSTLGRNFLLTVLRAGKDGQPLRVVADQVGAPTPATWVAQATALALTRLGDLSGTWHLVAEGETSWHGFAEAIFARAAKMGLIASPPQVIPISTTEYRAPARRPLYSRLDTRKIASDFGIILPHWHKGLQQVISELVR